MSSAADRARKGAWLALGLLLLSTSATALCVTLACPVGVSPPSCHTAPSGPRLSDCCAAHSSSTVASESRVATIAGPRLAQGEAAPVVAAPAAIALGREPSDANVGVVPLFTLHRSLLL